MDIFLTIVRVLLASFAVIVSTFYVLFQCWKKIPTPKINYTLVDGVVYVVVSILSGLGFNSSWALLAFLPLMFFKWFFHFLIQKKRVRGSGRWVEVEWRLYRNLEKELSQKNPAMVKEVSRIPKETHILLPRFAYLLCLKIVESQLNKNSKSIPPQVMNNSNFLKIKGDVDKFIRNSKTLPVGSTQEWNFQSYAKLKVARL